MTAVKPLARRALLRAGAASAIGVTALASCTAEPSTPDKPDPLAELAAMARTDAANATAVAQALPDLAGPATEIATARGEHATALQREVDREHPPASSTKRKPPAPTTPPDAASARTMLHDALTATEQRCGELITSVPRYRAGLVGSVAAGCASLREVLG
jgi:hypothetical protein